MQSRVNIPSKTALLLLVELILILATPSSQLNFDDLQKGPNVVESWYIPPGRPCDTKKEVSASNAFRALDKKADPTDVQRIVGDICFGGREVDINPLRCVSGICDCHHESYTWDPAIASCRTSTGGSCHNTGGLPCVTNSTCVSFRCRCSRRKVCLTKKLKADAPRIGVTSLVFCTSVAVTLIIRTIV